MILTSYWYYDIGHVFFFLYYLLQLTIPSSFSCFFVESQSCRGFFVKALWLPGAVLLALAALVVASTESVTERNLAARWDPAAYLASHPPWWSRQHPQAWWNVEVSKDAKRMKELQLNPFPKKNGSMKLTRKCWHKLPKKTTGVKMVCCCYTKRAWVCVAEQVQSGPSQTQCHRKHWSNNLGNKPL